MKVLLSHVMWSCVKRKDHRELIHLSDSDHDRAIYGGFFNVWTEDDEDEFHTGALVQTWASTSCLDTDNRVNNTVNRRLYMHLYVSICIVSIRDECLNSDRSIQSLFSLNSLNIVLLKQHVQVEIISSYSVDKAHGSFMIHDYLSFYYKMQDVFIWDSQKK